VSGIAAPNEPIRVFMPDGQMKSHLLRVFITTDLTDTDAPTLTLMASRLLVQQLPDWAEKPMSVREMARFQQWTETLDGHEIARTGTLLIFDLRSADFPWFKASMRVTPVIKWGEPRQTAVAERSVYIGNLSVAMVWTIVMVLVPVAMIIAFAYRRDGGLWSSLGNWKRLLSRPDGRMSLSKTQVAIWTLSIGTMLFCFGITRLEPPDIPVSLVALMGLSLTTRALTYNKEENAHRNPEKPRWRHLIDGSKDTDRPLLAITRAQMLFWTILVVCIFCVKTLLDGELWDVPWQLVALMGMSQASYMVPIYSKRDDASSGDAQRPTAISEQKPADNSGPIK
jgi:hypothetical protein